MPEVNIDSKSKKLLLETIARLDGQDSIDFIYSLLSSAEIKDISRRLMVAKLLKSDATYEAIVDIMGMSESTIGKIHAKTHGSPIISKLFDNNKD